jgi:hypothetical protein
MVLHNEAIDAALSEQSDAYSADSSATFLSKSSRFPMRPWKTRNPSVDRNN